MDNLNKTNLNLKLEKQSKKVFTKELKSQKS